LPRAPAHEAKGLEGSGSLEHASAQAYADRVAWVPVGYSYYKVWIGSYNSQHRFIAI